VFFRILAFTFVLSIFCSVEVWAQTNAADASKRSSNDNRRDDEPAASEGMLEMRYKWRREAEIKEFKETVERGETIAKLSKEIQESLAQSNNFSFADADKLNNAEKLIKKIRRSLGGSDSDETIKDDRPATLAAATERFAKLSATLSENLKKSTRYEVSAETIEQINELLDLIKLIRDFAKIK
jgi:hypothetical protein